MLIAKKPAKQGLSIIIVGCGKVGLTLIEQLVKEGHDITIIDQNAKRVQEVANTYDVMGITGNGASHRVSDGRRHRFRQSADRRYRIRRTEPVVLYGR